MNEQWVKGCLSVFHPHDTALASPAQVSLTYRRVFVLSIDPNLDQVALVPHASGLKPHRC